MERCPWAGTDPLYIAYHDLEWGVPVHDDRRLFEFLILEGAQAGLSWITILRKREAYRFAMDDFDPGRIVNFNDAKVGELLANPGIIRNRRKIEATIINARVFLETQQKFGSFDNYIWRFIGDKPLQNHWRTIQEIPVTTDAANSMSRDLIKRGFKFVGPTICYAYMQAIGMVNDHLVGCFRWKECRDLIK